MKAAAKRIGYSLGPLLSTSELLACAKLADALPSTDSIWVPESWGRESFSTLGAVSQVTARSRLGTSIVSIFSRTPATVAMAAVTLDTLSASRTVIGLGASTEAIVENWHGVKFERPLERMADFVKCFKMMTSGERVSYAGTYYNVKDFKILHPPARKKIPVYIGAVNKGMISLAAELADGVILYLRPLDELKASCSRLQKATAGRNFEIACSLICAVSDSEPEKARKRAAQTLAFYVAVGKYYRKFLSQNGYQRETSEISKTYAESGLQSAASCVTDRMLRMLTICGTREECKRSLGEFVSSGVSLPIIQFNPVDSAESSFRELLSTF
jgi:alkanesulfonate monooxygenase SsuD/methylene tetrahydromethanopterin reductase-like flavin-dependent oxidoreductase (luciferase family)